MVTDTPGTLEPVTRLRVSCEGATSECSDSSLANRLGMSGLCGLILLFRGMLCIDREIGDASIGSVGNLKAWAVSLSVLAHLELMVVVPETVLRSGHDGAEATATNDIAL